MRAFIKGLGLLTGCLAAIACGTASEDDLEASEGAATEAEIQSAFDVNDVSILFPLKGTSPYPQIKVTDGDLWTSEVFNQVITEAKSHQLAARGSGDNDFFTKRERWNIVGLRFDPCAPGFDDAVLAKTTGGNCIIQLRLIAQPYLAGSNASQDFAAHLVYDLGMVKKTELATSPVVQNAAKLLGEIKDASAKSRSGATAGQPLGVHPGLEAEAKGGGSEIANLVKSMVKTLTGASPKGSVAFMGLKNGGPEPWTFFAGRKENNAFTVQNGPIHGQRAQSLDFISGNGPVNPKSSARVSTTPLFDTSSDQLTPDQRKLAFQVENPKAAHFFSLDCVSCHTSSALTHDIPLGDKAEISARVKVPKNITGYVTKAQAQESSWNVRNFGYFFEKPTVSGRTVAETVEVVEWFNTNVRAPGKGINGPGPDCSAVDDKVWKCFRDAQKDCLKQCKPAPVPTTEVPVREPVPATLDRAGDPCTTPTVGGAPILAVTPSGSSLVAIIGGNDSQCLSRVLGGTFSTDPGIVLHCASPEACLIAIPGQGGVGKTEIKGEEFQRLRQFLRLSPSTFWQSSAPAGGVQLSCGSSSCTISMAQDAASLPDGAGTRINPR